MGTDSYFVDKLPVPGVRRHSCGSTAFAFVILLSTKWVSVPLFGETTSFELVPSTSHVRLGDAVEIYGKASFPEPKTLRLDPSSLPSDPFAVVEFRLEEPVSAKGMKTQKLVLKVIPFQAGPQTFPALDFALTGPQGAPERFPSPPVRFEVLPPETRPSDTGDIRDIHPPIQVFPWMAVLLACGLAALAAWLARRWLGRRPAPAVPRAPADMRPPHVIALEELKALEASGLWEQGRVKAYYDGLADILRRYLQRRYGLPAETLTTTDLLHEMRMAEVDRQLISLAREAFQHADLVKFARQVPEGSQRDMDIEKAREFVTLSV